MINKYNLKLNEKIVININNLLKYDKIPQEDNYKLNYLVTHYNIKK